MSPRVHTLVSFDSDLFTLRTGVLAMVDLAAVQFRSAIDALRRHDLSVAASVLAGEREINALHVSLDAACARVIARHQPTAVDLREVVCVLHSIGDLERIGDEAKKIAAKVPRLGGVDDGLLAPVLALAGTASTMLKQAGEAYRRRDPSIAASLHVLDERVDAERDRLVNTLARALERVGTGSHRVSTEALLDLVFIVQSIERVADHAEELSKYVVAIAPGDEARRGREGGGHGGES